MNPLAPIFAAIDALNAQDPTLEDGQPAEWLYGRRMSEMLARFQPDAEDALHIAVRGQHIQRWRVPRQDYPEGRIGYLRWRSDQKARHADTLAGLMRPLGFADDVIARVGAIVRKERLKQDADSQCLEDVACLVFLQFYAAAFVVKHPPEKVRDIIRKTWAKMSPAGQAAALKLDLPDALMQLIGRALTD